MLTSWMKTSSVFKQQLRMASIKNIEVCGMRVVKNFKDYSFSTRKVTEQTKEQFHWGEWT